MGWRVSVLSRSLRGFSGAQLYRGDLASPRAEVEEGFRNQDLILHAAVDYRSPEQTVAMTKNVVKFVVSAGNQKIIFISSQNAGFKNPRGYSLAKKQCEELLKARHSRWCIVRPTLIYDEGGGFLIGDLIQTARKFRVISVPGAGASRIQPVHAEDVAEVAVRSAGLPDGTTVTVAGREAVTLKELAEEIQKNIPGAFILSIPMGFLKLVGAFVPAVGDKVRELEQVKTLSLEEERRLSSVLPGPRRSILEDLPKLTGLTGRNQTKSNVLGNSRV